MRVQPVAYQSICLGGNSCSCMQVHYTGTLDDGTEFDSSRGKDPLEFIVGAGTVIRGFDLAVMGLRPGERRKHAVQPADGYGAALSPSAHACSRSSSVNKLNSKINPGSGPRTQA